MDERTGPQAAFAIQLCVDLLTALVVKDVLTRNQASALIDDTLEAVIPFDREHEKMLREIASTFSTQVNLVSIEADRRRGRNPDGP